jgi:CBS domain-containing protein
MKCSDVMTRDPVCCTASDSATKAARLMNMNDVGSLPVVSKTPGNRLIGIVTDRDLAMKIVGDNLSPEATRIEDVMTRDLVTCYPDDDLVSTMEAMSRYQIRRMPVIDSDGQLLGIIAQADIALRGDNDGKTAQLVEEISKPDTGM